MDEWGVDGCQEERQVIVSWFRFEYEKWGWGAKFRAGIRAVYTRLAFKVNPLDPFPGLLDEAIRLAKPPAG